MNFTIISNNLLFLKNVQLSQFSVRISKEESQKSLKEKLQKDLKSKVTKRKADLDMSNEAPKKQTRVTRSQVKSTDKGTYIIKLKKYHQF